MTDKQRIQELERQLAEAQERENTLNEIIEQRNGELSWTFKELTDLQSAVLRARNALHAHNRPNFPGRLRMKIRDILDKALTAPPEDIEP